MAFQPPKLENRITVGNILTIAIALIPAIGIYAITVAQSNADAAAIPDMRSRIEKIETRITIRSPQNDAFQHDTAQALSQILQTQATILARLNALDHVQ